MIIFLHELIYLQNITMYYVHIHVKYIDIQCVFVIAHTTTLNAYDTITTPDVNLSSYYIYFIYLYMYTH